MHYQRWRTIGTTAGREDRLEEIYRSRVAPPNENGCELWTGTMSSRGYGRFKAGGREYPAHRWGYLTFVGPVRDDQVVRHKCDVRACQAVTHLEVGSQFDNIHDCLSRGRGNRSRGERHFAAKLTEDDVRTIRALLAAGHLSSLELATQFGVDRSTISLIRTGKRWADVS